MELLHSIFSRKVKNLSEDDKTENWVTLASTQRQSIVLCEPQERNTNNRIFGGNFTLKTDDGCIDDSALGP